MANEIGITFQVAYENGSLKRTIAPGTLQVDQAAIGLHSPFVSVGTSEEDLAVGDISTLGWLYLHNLDPSNYVTYGPKSTTMVAIGRLEAGEMAWFRLEPGVTLRWIADTAAVNVEVQLFED